MKECPFASTTQTSDSKLTIWCRKPGGCDLDGKSMGITSGVTNPPTDGDGKAKWPSKTLEESAELFVRDNCPENRSKARPKRRS